MLTRIEVRADATGGRPRCDVRHGALSPRRLRTIDGSVRFALVAGTALLLAGDAVRIEIEVSGPVRLDVIETAGTVAYDMRGGSATWDVEVALRDGAALTWAGEPFIVADGAQVTRRTRLSLTSGCTALVRESLVLGRSGESGGDLRTSTRVDLDAAPVVTETLDLTRAARGDWIGIGPHRCLDTLATYGFRLPVESSVLQAAGPASIARWLGAEQHLSDLPARWADPHAWPLTG